MKTLAQNKNIDKIMDSLEKANFKSDRDFIDSYSKAFLDFKGTHDPYVDNLLLFGDWGLFRSQCSSQMRVFSNIRKLVDNGKNLDEKKRRRILAIATQSLDLESEYPGALITIFMNASLVNHLVDN